MSGPMIYDDDMNEIGRLYDLLAWPRFPRHLPAPPVHPPGGPESTNPALPGDPGQGEPSAGSPEAPPSTGDGSDHGGNGLTTVFYLAIPSHRQTHDHAACHHEIDRLTDEVEYLKREVARMVDYYRR